MPSDYREHLSAASLQLLSHVTGLGVDPRHGSTLHHDPVLIGDALAAPEADELVDADCDLSDRERRVLSIAVAVNRTASEICRAGWVAQDTSPIDLALFRLCGQSDVRQFVVELLATYMAEPSFLPEVDALTPAPPGSAERLHDLIELVDTTGDFERSGALRLLGDEALFAASIFPERPSAEPLNVATLARLPLVLPRALHLRLDDLTPDLHTLLDVHLMFGPVWYRMASKSLLQPTNRAILGQIATDFSVARRFIVRVAQGPLRPLRDPLFLERR